MASTTASTPTAPARCCSLGSAERTERLRDWEALRADALISEHLTGDTTVVVLERSADVTRRLQALIEAEKECCSFLRLHVTEDADRITVQITSTATED
jgi:hypothetical protein